MQRKSPLKGMDGALGVVLNLSFKFGMGFERVVNEVKFTSRITLHY